MGLTNYFINTTIFLSKPMNNQIKNDRFWDNVMSQLYNIILILEISVRLMLWISITLQKCSLWCVFNFQFSVKKKNSMNLAWRTQISMIDNKNMSLNTLHTFICQQCTTKLHNVAVGVIPQRYSWYWNVLDSLKIDIS